MKILTFIEQKMMENQWLQKDLLEHKKSINYDCSIKKMCIFKTSRNSKTIQ